MTKTLRSTVAIFALIALGACSGGGGSSSGGGGNPGPVTPAPSGPASDSIADLAGFAEQGTVTRNARGLRTAANAYQKNGVRNSVTLKGDQDVGLLTVQAGSNPQQKHTLIGASDNQVQHKGYYVGDASGSLRMRSADAAASVSGTAAVSMDAGSGKWQFGSDLWRQDGETGIYIGIDDGRVVGNTMVFDARNSALAEITPEGVNRSDEKAGSRMVFSDDGEQVFGKINGNNAATGFNVDAGFAGTQFDE